MLDANGEHLRQARRVAGGAQDGLEQQRRRQTVRAAVVGDGLQPGARAGVVGRAVEHLAVERDGIGQPADAATHLGEAEGQRRAAAGARQRQPLEQHRLDLVERAGPLVQPLERVERDVVGAELVGEPAIGEDGARVVALTLGQRRHGHDDRPPLVAVVAQLELAQVDVMELAPRGARLVDAHQRHEGLGRRRVGRQELPPGGERAVDVAERRLLLPRHRCQQRHTIDVGTLGGDALVVRHQLRPAAGARRQMLELAAHRRASAGSARRRRAASETRRPRRAARARAARPGAAGALCPWRRRCGHRAAAPARRRASCARPPLRRAPPAPRSPTGVARRQRQRALEGALGRVAPLPSGPCHKRPARSHGIELHLGWPRPSPGARRAARSLVELPLVRRRAPARSSSHARCPT